MRAYDEQNGYALIACVNCETEALKNIVYAARSL